MFSRAGRDAPANAGDRKSTLTSGALAVGGGALSIWTALDRGWIPFDEGTIALGAERAMHGALAHRDFLDPYTGGLAYWHALAMRVFGVSLMAPRYALFIACLVWLPALWWLAARWCGPRWAVVITVLGAWWSLPVYPAAMPTWYLLFIGTWIVVALERWRSASNDRKLRWLVAAGTLCGVAVLVKQTGLYLLAGTLLGLLFCDQEATRARRTAANGEGRTEFTIVLLLAVLGAMVLRLLWGNIGSGEMLHLLLPIGGLLALAVWREWRLTGDRGERWRTLFRDVGTVTASAVVPVALYLVPFALSGSLGALYSGAIGVAATHITLLHRGMRPAGTLLLAVWPVYALLSLELFARGRRVLTLTAIAGGLALLWFSFRTAAGYKSVWFFRTSLLPLAVGAVLYASARAWRAKRAFDPMLLVLAGIMTLHALNQFPFSAPVYYAYVAPLAILAAAAAASHFGLLPRLNTAALLLAGFAGVVLRIGSLYNVGYYPAWWDYSHRLAVPRGGILVTQYDSVRYTALLGLIAQHRGQGAVYAGPELPEVYFLAGSPSPGRDSYSLFATPVGDSVQLARTFDVTAASVLVIKSKPSFVPSMRQDVYEWLVRRYPRSETMDTLQIRWRDAP